MSLMQIRKRFQITSNHPLHHFTAELNSIPIIYNSHYNISFYKLEQAHPFDCKKWGKVAKNMLEYFQVCTVLHYFDHIFVFDIWLLICLFIYLFI